MRIRWILLPLVLLPAASVSGAQEMDDELGALDLKPAQRQETRASNIHGYGEAGGARYLSNRAGVHGMGGLRASLELRLRQGLGEGRHLQLSDHLDLSCPRSGDRRCVNANTLKEAYFSFRPAPSLTMDAGRVNARYGVAYGYNPTDLFRHHAIRSVSSYDPESLRENRLGSAMIRAQYRWGGSSITAIVSPRLGRQASSKDWSLDWGASNQTHRWMAAYSPDAFGPVTGQFIVGGDSARGTLLGANLSSIVTDASTVHMEWLAEYGLSQETRALGLSGHKRWMHRASAGGTYTTRSNMSLTLEYEYNGLAPGRAGWEALRAGPGLEAYRGYVDGMQDLMTRRNLLAYLTWNRLANGTVTVTAMYRRDLVDRSSMAWLETRKRLDDVDLAMQLMYTRGDENSSLASSAYNRQIVFLARKSF